jgi:hypothetical protein
MLPITVTHFIFYKNPGGIPVERCGGGGTPGILPVEVKLYKYRLRAYVTPGEGDIGNSDIIRPSNQATRDTQPQD